MRNNELYNYLSLLTVSMLRVPAGEFPSLIRYLGIGGGNDITCKIEKVKFLTDS
jgi:hypothetical protein